MNLETLVRQGNARALFTSPNLKPTQFLLPSDLLCVTEPGALSNRNAFNHM